MNRDLLFLRDMVEACDKIASYVSVGKDSFMLDDRTQDAIIRRLEILGEASKQLSSEIKARAAGEPWSRIGRMRDKLIHHYFSVDLEVIWDTATSVVPAFRNTLLELLAIVETRP